MREERRGRDWFEGKKRSKRTRTVIESVSKNLSLDIDDNIGERVLNQTNNLHRLSETS
jgi:hypothetical protein